MKRHLTGFYKGDLSASNIDDAIISAMSVGVDELEVTTHEFSLAIRFGLANRVYAHVISDGGPAYDTVLGVKLTVI